MMPPQDGLEVADKMIFILWTTYLLKHDGSQLHAAVFSCLKAEYQINQMHLNLFWIPA